MKDYVHKPSTQADTSSECLTSELSYVNIEAQGKRTFTTRQSKGAFYETHDHHRHPDPSRHGAARGADVHVRTDMVCPERPRHAASYRSMANARTLDRSR